MHFNKLIYLTMIRLILLFTYIVSITFPLTTMALDQSQKQEATILFTTDIHGSFFPFDYIQMKECNGSYARVITAVDSIRKNKGDGNVLLLDNGDILQGQPTVYYYNFVDTASTHIAADIFNFINVDAVSIGNHDIETGHAVYDRWKKELKAPILAANIIDKKTNKAYFKPYTTFNRGGLKIAVLGLITPAIPAWLPENLWSGLFFESMESTAEKWIKIIQERESVDVIIGLFHSGRDATKTTAGYIENASMTTAMNVDGFDAVLMGHDHSTFCDTIINRYGHTVHLINPANNGLKLGSLTISKIANTINIKSELIDVSTIPPSERFLKHFQAQELTIKEFVDTEIAEITDSIFTRDAFFGPSEFMTLLHDLQLSISSADISMAAPLTFDGQISKGTMKVADMFTLYKYENMLTTLKLTGKEIKDYLEFSYSLWTNCIADGQHLIYFDSNKPTKENNKLKNPTYNFDSAAGIKYTVDVTKPKGQKINITTLSSGEPFRLESTYTVAVNSYRAGGGGNHLIEGAGITADELKRRVISTTDKDLRYYIIELLRNRKIITPHIDRNWRFIPEETVDSIIKIDRELLFGNDSSRIQK